jgi:hypothetical protein
MSIQIIKNYSLWLCLFIVTLPVYAANPQVVGHTIFVKGSNVAQLSGAAPRTLEKNTEIFQGDSIQTTESSFVIVEFTDGAKVTVRPNSNFSIDHYDNQSADKTAQLVLHKGEVNASTGQITTDNPENFQITTPTGTVKPQSAKSEFTVNICKDDCDKIQAAAGTTQQVIRLEQKLVARVVEIKGEVSAINRANKDAKERILSLGKPLYNTDFIHSKKDSWALIVFPDGEKLTLQPDSEMDIKQYNYQVSGKKDQILLRLAMGGLRALSGSIGQTDHDAFALDTPVATIGIRGTETFTVITKGNTPPLVNIDHSTLQGLSVAKYTDENGKSNESEIPAGSTLQMAGSPTPPGGAQTGGAPGFVVGKPPVVKPTPPTAPKPQGPPLIPNPAATKALFEVKNAPLVTLVKMISGNGKIVSKDGQNSAGIKPGDTGTIKPNSDLTIRSPRNSSDDKPANNTDQSNNTDKNTDPSKDTTTTQNTPNLTGGTQSEQQVTNTKELIESVKQSTKPASPN